MTDEQWKEPFGGEEEGEVPEGFITDPIASMVESGGWEASVTLVVDGVVIEGFLAPVNRWIDWMSESLHRTMHGRGHFRAVEVPPPDERMIEETQARWADRDPDLPRIFPVLAIRSARIDVGSDRPPRSVPFLLVNAGHVSAFTLGITKAPDD